MLVKAIFQENLVANVNGDDFRDFLNYLKDIESFNIDQIIEVVCEPHKYKKEYKNFLEVVDL